MSLPSQDSGISPDQTSEESIQEVSQESQGEQSQTSQEQVAELQSEIQQAVSEGATKQEVAKLIKEFELKVNGKTVKKSFDLSNDEEIKKELQKAAAFQEVSQTHQQMVKNLQAKIASWKANPELMLKEMEIDDLDFAEKRVQREIDNMKKTPQEKALEEAQAKLLAYQEKERQMEEQLAEQRRQQENQAAYDSLRGEIKSAFEGHEGLKYTEDNERGVADMMAAYSEKFPDITAEQILPLYEKKLQSQFNALLENMPDAYIEKFISKNAIERISNKVKKPVAAPTRPKPPVTSTQVNVPTTSSVKNAEKDKPKRTFEDVWR